MTIDHLFKSGEGMNDSTQEKFQSVLSPSSRFSGIYYPNTPEELSEIVTEISAQKKPILPYGNGSKLDWGGLIQGCEIAVSTQGLNRLIEHAVGDLTVTVEAGIKFAELQAILAKSGQFIALDPAYPNQATVGGIIATADTGSLRQRYRGVRDMLLGISFVRSDGKIAKAGGRVVKNVAGYDLMKLLTGSYGTLGIINQVTLRVYPLPETSQSVFLSGTSAALSQLIKTLLLSSLSPVSLDLLSSPLVQHLQIGSDQGILVRFQSISLSVKEQSQRLVEMGENLGLTATIYPEKEEIQLWQKLSEQIYSNLSPGSILCKIGIIPTEALNFIPQIPQASTLIHAGIGLGTIQLEEISPENLLKIRQWCQSHGGFLTVLKAPLELKQKIEIWGYNGNALNLMHGIKKQFDPDSLFSPHRFILPL